MLKYFCLSLLGLALAGCGASKTATDSQNQQSADYINKQMAIYSAVNGNYYGTMVSTTTGKHVTNEVWLEVKATVVFVANPSTNQEVKVPTILGFLHRPEVTLPTPASNISMLLKSQPPDSKHTTSICALNGSGQRVCGYPTDDNWNCDKTGICQHFSVLPDMVKAAYQMGMYDPNTHALQFWSTAAAPAQPDLPVVGTPGLSLQFDGGKLSGIYMAPEDLSFQITLAKKQ